MDRKWSEVWIPKIGWVRFRRHRNIPGIVRNAKVSYTPSIGWEVSFGVAAKPHIAPPKDLPGSWPQLSPTGSKEARRARAPQGPPAQLGEAPQRR